MNTQQTAPAVTQAQVDALIEQVTVQTIFEKVTFVAARLKNGFVLTESAGAVSVENYDEAIGKAICLKKINDRIWELEGYRLSAAVHASPSTSSGQARPYPAE